MPRNRRFRRKRNNKIVSLPTRNFRFKNTVRRKMATGNMVYYFKRNTPAVYLYCGTAGALGTIVTDIANSPGSPAPNVTLSSMTADVFTNTAQFGMGFLFRLSDVINYTEFTTLFDSYQISAISIKFDLLTGNIVSPTLVQFSQLPEIWLANDYDDAVPPASLTTIQQYEGVKRFKMEQSRTDSKYLKPRITTLAYKSSGTTIAFTNPKKTSDVWIDCSNADVEHYGLHGWICNFPTDIAKGTLIRMQFTYYLRFKTLR